MPDNTDHDSGEQLAGPGSKEVQARNNWFSRAARFIVSRCKINDIGRDAKFENYRFGALYQRIVFVAAPSTSQSHTERVVEANGLSYQLPVTIYRLAACYTLIVISESANRPQMLPESQDDILVKDGNIPSTVAIQEPSGFLS